MNRAHRRARHWAEAGGHHVLLGGGGAGADQRAGLRQHGLHLGGAGASLAAWRAAQGQERLDGQPVGVFADPLLTKPGGGGILGDPQKLSGLAAYLLLPGSPAVGAGLDPRRFAVDPGPRDYYGTPLPPGVGYDIGAHQSRR